MDSRDFSTPDACASGSLAAMSQKLCVADSLLLASIQKIRQNLSTAIAKYATIHHEKGAAHQSELSSANFKQI